MSSLHNPQRGSIDDGRKSMIVAVAAQDARKQMGFLRHLGLSH